MKGPWKHIWCFHDALHQRDTEVLCRHTLLVQHYQKFHEECVQPQRCLPIPLYSAVYSWFFHTLFVITVFLFLTPGQVHEGIFLTKTLTSQICLGLYQTRANKYSGPICLIRLSCLRNDACVAGDLFGWSRILNPEIITQKPNYLQYCFSIA